MSIPNLPRSIRRRDGHSRSCRTTLLSLFGICLAALPLPASAGFRERLRVTGIEFLGAVTFPTGTFFAGTEVGGLSAISHDPSRDLYYVLSDDRSQFLAFAIAFEAIPAVLPAGEPPRVIDQEEPVAGTLAGDADDPAIWLHPSNPARSLVITALKDGGLAVFDLKGQVRQIIRPA